MPGGGDREDFADAGRACEVHAAHGAMSNEGFDNRRGVRGIVSQDVDYSVIQPGFAEDGADQAMRRRTNFRRFQNDCIPAGKRHSNRTHAENDGSVPGRDPEDDAHWLPDGECEAPGNLGGDNLA